MTYTSIADLANTIRTNLWKIPNDVTLIVGVPRSGMLAALLVGEFLHKPVIDLDGYIAGREAKCGSRGKHMRAGEGRVLVLDDTVYSGRSMADVRKRVNDDSVLFGCIYAEGRKATELVDVWFENNYNPHEELWHLYEWNILHHGDKLSTRTMFDLDGVLCAEPPDERNKEQYENYIANARPLIIPTTKLRAIVTYRRECYRSITEQWLAKHGIEYDRLIMSPEYGTRRSNMDAALQKASCYAHDNTALLFVESDKAQAEIIANRTGKQVFCYSNGKMY